MLRWREQIVIIIKQAVFTGLCLGFLSGCSSFNHNVREGLNKSSARSRISKFVAKPLSNDERLRLATVAKSAIGMSKLTVGSKSFRNDCSGTIRAIFAKAQLRLGGIIKSPGDNDVKTIYRYAQKYGKILKSDPQPGDLVFFHNTYDRSRNGRMNDALTHIGIVEKVEGNITHFVHHLGDAIIRSRMDLTNPNATFDPKNGERTNHILRRAQSNNRAYTAGELFAGFGRL